MPKLDNLRPSQTIVDSKPFVITGPDGRILFSGYIRLVFTASRAGAQIVQLDAASGVRLVPDDGFRDFIPEHDEPDCA